MTQEQPTPSRGITSDVASDIVEHARMVHEWTEAHPEWKKQYVEDKPKIRNRCGGCAAFHTPFCTWEYKDMETTEAYKIHEKDYACGLFFPRLKFSGKRSAEKFKRRVENL